MKTASIENLAYFMKKAKDNNLPSPIFFLGAGASRTGKIPLASEIITDILKRYPDNPHIKSLNKEEKNYSRLMECLGPNGRNQLLKKYIDSSKINVTHIYLAQLMQHGYVDYVLTVNFDNLMLRALALLNEFPSTYDMAILKDLTTTTFKEKSVVYLHGQHHGLWLLNTEDEMAKVNEVIPQILNKISNERPWVFIGYSGEDPVFKHIKNLGRFDNGLYWVTYKDDIPVKSVCEDLFDKPNTNAFLIKGYDADSFMLKLNSELKLPQPSIVDKPFSSLSLLLGNIVDIDDQEHFKGVKERLVIAKDQVKKAIQQFEEGKVESSANIQENSEIGLLKKEIIGLIIEEDYQAGKISEISNKAEVLNNVQINSLLADLYASWGFHIGNLAQKKSDGEAEGLYQQAFAKYQQAIEIKPGYHEVFYNWGTDLGRLAQTKSGNEVEGLYQQAFAKYQQVIEIKPGYHEAYFNWGTFLGELAQTKLGDEAEALYKQAFAKYQQVIKFKPNNYKAYYNWGADLVILAQTKSGDEAKDLYQQAFAKFQQTIDIKPDSHNTFFIWGVYLGELAQTKSGDEAEDLYQQAFTKYQQAIEIKPDYYKAFDNWGTDLGELARTKSGGEAEALYQQAFEKLKTAIDLGASSYNLACIYALKLDKENALLYLNRSLKNKEIMIDFVKGDKDWTSYLQDEGFNKIISLYAS